MSVYRSYACPFLHWVLEARCKKVTLTGGLSKLSASSLFWFPFCLWVFSCYMVPCWWVHTLLPTGLFITCGWSWHQDFFSLRVSNWRCWATNEPSLNQSIVYLSTENKVYAGKKKHFKTTNSVNICLFYINSLRGCYSLLSRPVFLATLRRSLNITLVSCYWTAITELWRLHSFWNCNSLVNLWVSISSLYKHLLSATLKHSEKKKYSLDWALSISALFSSFILLPPLLPHLGN